MHTVEVLVGVVMSLFILYACIDCLSLGCTVFTQSLSISSSLVSLLSVSCTSLVSLLSVLVPRDLNRTQVTTLAMRGRVDARDS